MTTQTNKTQLRGRRGMVPGAAVASYNTQCDAKCDGQWTSEVVLMAHRAPHLWGYGHPAQLHHTHYGPSLAFTLMDSFYGGQACMVFFQWFDRPKRNWAALSCYHVSILLEIVFRVKNLASYQDISWLFTVKHYYDPQKVSFLISACIHTTVLSFSSSVWHIRHYLKSALDCIWSIISEKSAMILEFLQFRILWGEV